jgi:ribonucleotide monophosphatase NagD (HAD superfamily)
VAERKKISWERSVVVGDALRDLDAGRQLGCQTVLVLSGKTQREETADWPFQPDHIAGSLIAAAPWILKWVRQR